MEWDDNMWERDTERDREILLSRDFEVSDFENSVISWTYTHCEIDVLSFLLFSRLDWFRLSCSWQTTTQSVVRLVTYKFNFQWVNEQWNELIVYFSSERVFVLFGLNLLSWDEFNLEGVVFSFKVTILVSVWLDWIFFSLLISSIVDCEEFVVDSTPQFIQSEQKPQ
jgi:hypothetical protein